MVALSDAEMFFVVASFIFHIMHLATGVYKSGILLNPLVPLVEFNFDIYQILLYEINFILLLRLIYVGLNRQNRSVTVLEVQQSRPNTDPRRTHGRYNLYRLL